MTKEENEARLAKLKAIVSVLPEKPGSYQYYDADDAGAKAKYDRLSKQVEAQDKKLQLDLDNIETQRDAVKTEIDSVEKVINENIEKKDEEKKIEEINKINEDDKENKNIDKKEEKKEVENNEEIK